MPQHYSVTMEIAKDRTTKATVETCRSDKFEQDQCPRDVAIGQDFIRRSLNEPCHEMVSAVQCRVHQETTLKHSRVMSF